ncbi:hypothetical protein EVAR_77664_1 [Eumeta japonica]|uniref:Uncharacterized protein n=1 Tax=Eumeta variegata TaxID=151549 RepID=A0A4C1T9N9_EUMVA|nr:hypothetical protein EVAR_77664_1 [Eumeta japonica]
MSIEYELVDESDPDPLGKLPARKSTRTAAKLTEGSEQRSLVDERYRIGKEIRFYWLRAHVIKGNERADELAKIAAQKADADYDYEKIPYPGYEVARYDLEHKIETKLENENARNNGEPRKSGILSFAEKVPGSHIQT